MCTKWDYVISMHMHRSDIITGYQNVKKPEDSPVSCQCWRKWNSQTTIMYKRDVQDYSCNLTWKIHISCVFWTGARYHHLSVPSMRDVVEQGVLSVEDLHSYTCQYNSQNPQSTVDSGNTKNTFVLVPKGNRISFLQQQSTKLFHINIVSMYIFCFLGTHSTCLEAIYWMKVLDKVKGEKLTYFYGRFLVLWTIFMVIQDFSGPIVSLAETWGTCT